MSTPSCSSTGNATVGADAAADPVALHQLDRLGPVEQVEVGEQAVGVRGDAQHPLLQRAAEHRVVAALAAAVGGDLLVREHGAERRAPVDRRLVEVREAVRVDDGAPLRRRRARATPASSGLASLSGSRVPASNSATSSAIGRARSCVVVVPGVEDLQEDPLRPAVVVDVGGGDAPPRVVAEPERAQLAAHGGDVRLGGDARVLAGLHRVLLGREAERVVAHRVQHVVAVHAHEAGVDVGADVAERVADVQAGAARVREHVEHEELAPVGDGVEPVGSARPMGLGVQNVCSASQRSCHFASISLARRGVVPVLGGDLGRAADVSVIGGRAYRACSRARAELGNRRWYRDPSRGCSSVGRALPWHGRRSWVRVPSAPRPVLTSGGQGGPE